MALHVVTPSGLHIDQLDGHYIVSKGKQVDVYKTYGAMVTGLTSGTGTKKPKRAKAASKPRKARKARRAAAPQAAPKPRKRRRASKPKARKAAKRRSTLNSHGHKRGCKCMACSPATRKAAALGRKRAARKAGKGKGKAKAKKSKKGGGRGGRGGGRWSGYNPSTVGRTFGGDPDEMRRPGRPRKAEIYRGDVARFNGGGRRKGNGRTHSSGMTYHMPARNPIGALGSGYASFRGGRRGAW